jgi:hypothetical protein
MKTFKEYLSESKKVYSFKVKVAGEIPEGFQDKLKTELDRCKLITLEKVATTPIQKFPLDFPNMSNAEVTVFEVICEYPINAQEIVNSVKSIGLAEESFRVRGSGEPSEIDQLLVDNEPSGKALLADSNYKETTNAKHKDYFGDDFNKGFLKDLDKVAKALKKEGVQTEYKLPKAKTDKAGAKSALGS